MVWTGNSSLLFHSFVRHGLSLSLFLAFVYFRFLSMLSLDSLSHFAAVRLLFRTLFYGLIKMIAKFKSLTFFVVALINFMTRDCLFTLFYGNCVLLLWTHTQKRMVFFRRYQRSRIETKNNFLLFWFLIDWN